MSRLVLSFALALLTLDGLAQAPPDFYRVDGPRILNGEGEPGVVRGLGLGGWLMPETYMLDMPFSGSITEISRRIEALVGPADTERFWELYREHYVAQKDVDWIAEQGFDHIRLPLHYGLFMDIQTGEFLEDGFAIVDEFLGWCEAAGLEVILDLHAAPGGQNEGDISDSDGVARLWTEPDPYQDLTVALWTEMASRYAEDTRIIGYDLINEPVTPNSIGDGAQALRDLYGRLVEAIRTVDTNHIVFIEGNYYATTFDKLTPPFDDKLVYSYHKYWNAPSIGTIQYLLNIRTDHNVPLWLGETGENSNPWYHQVIKLHEDNEVGWNWWTHKQIQATAAPLSVPRQSGYQRVLDYWAGQAATPSAGEAAASLFGMARGLSLDSADVRVGVLNALLNPDFDTYRQPYTDLRIPGTVGAYQYDHGAPGVTYSDAGVWAVTGSPGGGNNGGRLRNDGVDIEASSDPQGMPYNVGWTEPLEWIEYTVQVETTGRYDIETRVASLPGGGSFSLSMDGERLGSVSVPSTGGWQSWRSEWIRDVPLEAGEQVLRFTVGRKGDFNINQMTFVLVQTGTGVQAEVPGALEIGGPYPQPAHRQVRFDSERAPSAVYDILGRVVDVPVRHSGNQVELDLTGLASGIYVAWFDQAQKTFVVRRH